MNLLGIGDIIKGVGDVADNLITTDEERLEKAIEQDKLNIQYEQEVTKRWESDNEHLITRLVRPFIVLWSFILLTIVMLFDGNFGGFTIKDSYIPMLETIVVTSVVSYMGARSLDKWGKAKK